MEDYQTKRYRDRIRILLVIYFFSEPYQNPDLPDTVALIKSEVKIQKLDFLIRYPNYLCYELMHKMQEDSSIDRNEIMHTVRRIIGSNEPLLRTIEMKKFLYGAWENLDKTILFLKAHGLIDFKSQMNSNLRQYNKEYYLTKLGKSKVEAGLESIQSLNWYRERCLLIKKFFGDMGGSELKALQYQHGEYKDAMINDYIQDIEQQTINLFTTEFQEVI